MVTLLPRLRRRWLCTRPETQNHWTIKQITNSNFNHSLTEIKSHIFNSDFLAISLKRTGSFSSPWHHVSSFDTADIAYLKTKHAADRFQILQFALCPFTVSDSKVTAYPYNFHLFPRDEFKIGMPSYSFCCHSSYLSKLVQEGFDFNACVNDGISYLSRAQESAAKVQLESPVLAKDMAGSNSTLSVADSVFVQRTRSRVKNWKRACTDKSSDEGLVKSLRKLVLGLEEYNSRPCINIDVCTERQVQLVIEMLKEFADDLVPLIVPRKSGGTQAVRVVLTSSKEDKELLQMELQNREDEQNKKIRGFREVIDLISTAQKPLVCHNSLNDLAFIYSKFLAPLPPTMDEFMRSLQLAFPQVIDISHLMKEVSPPRKVTNISVASSYLKNRFFAPVDLEIPFQGVINEGKTFGHDVIRICQLFAKLCYILRLPPNSTQRDNKNLASAMEGYANIFSPHFTTCQQPADEEDIRIWTNSTRKVSCQDLLFLWGFRQTLSASKLKSLLQQSHKVFAKEFNVRFVDKSCAIVVFWEPGLSKTFIDDVNVSPETLGPLGDMISEGIRAAGYDAYSRACRFGLWDENLADSLDKASADPERSLESDSVADSLNPYLCSEWMINLDEL